MVFLQDAPSLARWWLLAPFFQFGELLPRYGVDPLAESVQGFALSGFPVLNSLGGVLLETLKDAFKNPERAFFGIAVWVIHGSLQRRHPWRVV